MCKTEDLYQYNDFNNLLNNLNAVLRNISEYNTKFNAFCRVYEDDAKLSINKLSEKIIPNISNNSNNRYPLAGMIIGIKDLFCYKGHITQAASKILENFIPDYNAAVVDMLLTAGGTIIGHQNCDEFGMGSSNTSTIYGVTHNFLDYNRTTGGSSGGSALSVQANMCHVSLGTDTGGSIRQPASYCGIIGFRPSYGVISRYGVIAHSSSFDTVGILGKRISDIIDVFNVISIYDIKDSSMVDYKKLNTQLCNINSNFKLCILNNLLDLSILQAEVKDGIKNAIDIMSKSFTIYEENIENVDLCSSVYFTLTTIEASSNLSRYTGVNYGYRTKEYSNFDEMIIKTRTEGFGGEVKKRIFIGNYLLETNSENKYIDKALNLREKFRRRFDEMFRKYDFIILPITSTTAFFINEGLEDNNSFWDDNFATLASIVGYPAISIPCGVDNNNMPFGIQIIGNKYKDNELLEFADKIVKLLK